MKARRNLRCRSGAQWPTIQDMMRMFSVRAWEHEDGRVVLRRTSGRYDLYGVRRTAKTSLPFGTISIRNEYRYVIKFDSDKARELVRNGEVGYVTD